MLDHTNKIILNIYEVLTYIKKEFQKKVKADTKVSVSVDEHERLTFNFYICFNREKYFSTFAISKFVILENNMTTIDLIDTHIDIESKRIIDEIRKVEKEKICQKKEN